LSGTTLYVNSESAQTSQNCLEKVEDLRK